MNEDLLGLWHCQLVDQERSEEATERFGEYADEGFMKPQKAAKTDYAGATLELHDDGRYELRGPSDYQGSLGTWSVEGGQMRLSQADECVNGYERLEYATQRGDRFVVAFRLVPDAHDGLDVLVLTFGREQPDASTSSFIEKLMAVEGEDDLHDVLNEGLTGGDAWSSIAGPSPTPG